jgi:hypothetical protein
MGRCNFSRAPAGRNPKSQIIKQQSRNQTDSTEGLPRRRKGEGRGELDGGIDGAFLHERERSGVLPPPLARVAPALRFDSGRHAPCVRSAESPAVVNKAKAPGFLGGFRWGGFPNPLRPSIDKASLVE